MFMLGWMGNSRYFMPSVIFLSIFFGNGLNYFMNLKSKKNNVEINNIIKSYIYDGTELTKFIFWIKNNINKLKITELSAQKKLEQFRKKNRIAEISSFVKKNFRFDKYYFIRYKKNTPMILYDNNKDIIRV